MVLPPFVKKCTSRWVSRGENAVVVGGNQWPRLAAPDSAYYPPDQQPNSNGKPREFPATRISRLGYLQDHDCGGSGDARHLLNWAEFFQGVLGAVTFKMLT
jgi:hypothetical protein